MATSKTCLRQIGFPAARWFQSREANGMMEYGIAKHLGVSTAVATEIRSYLPSAFGPGGKGEAWLAGKICAAVQRKRSPTLGAVTPAPLAPFRTDQILWLRENFALARRNPSLGGLRKSRTRSR